MITLNQNITKGSDKLPEENDPIRSELLYALAIPTKETLIRFLQDFRREARKELREQSAAQAAGLAALYFDLAMLQPNHETIAGQKGKTAMEMAINDMEYGSTNQPRYELQGVVFPGLPVDPIYLRISPKNFTSLLTTLGARPVRMSLTGGRPETFLEISAPEMLPLLPEAMISLLPPLKRRARAIAGMLEMEVENIIVRLKPALTPDDLFIFRQGNTK